MCLSIAERPFGWRAAADLLRVQRGGRHGAGPLGPLAAVAGLAALLAGPAAGPSGVPQARRLHADGILPDGRLLFYGFQSLRSVFADCNRRRAADRFDQSDVRPESFPSSECPALVEVGQP